MLVGPTRWCDLFAKGDILQKQPDGSWKIILYMAFER
jgi:hypothetical protein